MDRSSTRPLDVDDTVALIAVLATLEALVSAHRLEDSDVAVLRHSLALGGAVLPGADTDEIVASLGALNGRLRDSIA
ncbi:hypothetical protein GRS96_18350 [Rathayibacter sp. VKM Ac-2803]|uniref:hypothetical protein n=1 Tax=unclassified Rathayibacter TaxID=2609250 RepID=UPI00135B86C2|nr:MULTISPECIES: hypothetical protein [unclassified Rathayibacter]MWV51235.1 hypothetical protein [Rathayibacter sp. VKM Ac-2803]MWV57719.1 hypothetical protein [Rathayibacter sp. VKM Ac-2754]